MHIQSSKFDFSPSQEKFLNEYKPENRMFTSYKEIYAVKNVFCLSKMNYKELMHLRDNIVLFYGEKLDKTRFSDIKEHDKFMQAMQSITAVIDYQMYNF